MLRGTAALEPRALQFVRDWANRPGPAPRLQSADEGRRILFAFPDVVMTGRQPNIVLFFWEDPG